MPAGKLVRVQGKEEEEEEEEEEEDEEEEEEKVPQFVWQI